jgi:hypothetical protein
MRALAPGLSARRGDVCLLTRAPQERVTAQIDAGPDPSGAFVASGSGTAASGRSSS